MRQCPQFGMGHNLSSLPVREGSLWMTFRQQHIWLPAGSVATPQLRSAPVPPKYVEYTITGSISSSRLESYFARTNVTLCVPVSTYLPETTLRRPSTV